MTTEQKVIKSKVGLLALAQTLGNVSQACKVMGYSRDSFYRFKELYETGGALAVQEISRKKPVVKNRVDAEIEKAVVALAVEQPASGQVRAAHELKQRGVFISPGGVRCVWLRHDLETFRKRLTALEAKSAQENFILTEAQVAAIERAKQEQEAHGEIETEHPGYLGAQDTYYVGTPERRRAHLSADLHRHLYARRFRQTLRPEERAGGGRSARATWCCLSLKSKASGSCAC